MSNRRLQHEVAVPFLLDALEEAHRREPFVGGLFNAYEVGVHYELYNAALVEKLWDTGQEEPLGRGQMSCDLVLPLVANDWMWLEVKQWWFLNQAFEQSYVNFGKTKAWPHADWKKLATVPRGKHRAVLLLRCWDDETAKEQADSWLDDLMTMMTKSGAPRTPTTRSLKSFAYPSPRPHTRHGDAIIWSSTTR